MAALLVGLAGTARAAEGDESITAVSSRVSRDYVRVRMSDGSFQREEYTFGDGGHYPGPFADATIDSLDFRNVAAAIAAPLERQHYFPSRDPQKTKLLIMVYWGTTTVSLSPSASSGYQLYQSAAATAAPAVANTKIGGSISDTSAQDEAFAMIDMDNRLRDHLDYTNAQMLGYDSENVIATEYGAAIARTALRGHRDELVSEIERNRYFVILMAYDFQLMWREKKHKLLWETRFSLDQARNDFGRDLPAMAQYASQYFGRDTDGLIRKPVPLGRVEVGQPTVIELFSPQK
jgi:hypothetical protein